MQNSCIKIKLVNYTQMDEIIISCTNQTTHGSVLEEILLWNVTLPAFRNTFLLQINRLISQLRVPSVTIRQVLRNSNCGEPSRELHNKMNSYLRSWLRTNYPICHPLSPWFACPNKHTVMLRSHTCHIR